MSMIDLAQKYFHAIFQRSEIRVPTLAQSLFLQSEPVVESGSDVIELETVKGFETISEHVSRNSTASDGTKIYVAGNATNRKILFPLTQDEFAVDSGLLNRRIVGFESPYRPLSREARRLYYSAELMKEIVKSQLRGHEYAAMTTFFDAALTTPDGAIDFGRTATLKNRKVVEKWSVTATANPLKDLGDALKAIRQTSKMGSSPFVFALMSEGSFENFLKWASAQKENQNIRINNIWLDNFANVPPQAGFMIASGAVYHGWVTTPYGAQPVHVFTYPEYYEASGSSTAYVPANKVAVCSYFPEAFKTFYGPGKRVAESAYYENMLSGLIDEVEMEKSEKVIGGARIPMEVFNTVLYPLGRGTGDGGVVESAPLFVPRFADCVATLTTEIK